MIAYRGREGKRGKVTKLNRTLERLYREGKCRDCSVVVTRMDFAKILGKFTKVKIQYASSSTGKTQKTPQTKKNEVQASSISRLKKNENGMVDMQRVSHNKNPVKDSLNTKKLRNKVPTPPPPQVNMNILKENNTLKCKLPTKDKNYNYNNKITSNGKQYTIIFDDPSTLKVSVDIKSDLTLSDLLPKVEKTILPSDEWCIDYFPKQDEPKNDKVYDRIAAELEDLMYNEKPDVKCTKQETTVSKPDEFPSIMDILNDNVDPESTSEPKDQSNSIDFKDNLESSDVEAMLLGKSNDSKTDVDNKLDVDSKIGVERKVDDEIKEDVESKVDDDSKEDDDKMDVDSKTDVDSTDVNKLINDVVQFTSNSEPSKDDVNVNEPMEIENPHSPSILDEALQKGIEEHLPSNPIQNNSELQNDTLDKHTKKEDQNDSNLENCDDTVVCTKNSEIVSGEPELSSSLNIPSTLKMEDVTHVIFKKVVDGKCIKSVACPKNLKYSIELEEKSVEFLGAPKYISSLEDLQVLLQIVNETDLRSLYVLY